MKNTMRRMLLGCTVGSLFLAACGGSKPPETPASEEPVASEPLAPARSESDASSQDPNEFGLKSSSTAGSAHGVKPSTLKPTTTEAVLKFFVVDKKTGPVEGLVIALVSSDGEKFYTSETDAVGYAEVLVPVGKKYELTYLTLGREDITASVTVADEPAQNIKLTLNYENRYPDRPVPPFVLGAVQFDTARATIKPESFAELDRVVEYMLHKGARLEIAGHTDNVGNPKSNKSLSLRRAQACRDYIVSKGVDPERIEAVGFGDEKPIAPNDTPENRAKNRRIEVREIKN